MYNILSVDGRGATQALIATKIIQIIDEKLNRKNGKQSGKFKTKFY